MITLIVGEDKTAITSFESRDTLEEIASVCRCTAYELADLMHHLYLTDWHGQKVYWKEEE